MAAIVILGNLYAALASTLTAVPIFCSVLASLSQISCSDSIQKLSTVSLIRLRVLSRSSRTLLSRVCDILGPRYFT